jgi:hypothetical protein
MKFRVSQGFETLGDACGKTFETREEADAAAAMLREEIADMVSEWAPPEAEWETSDGYSNECKAWMHAVALADGAATYGNAAGEYIAKQAVTIEVVA